MSIIIVQQAQSLGTLALESPYVRAPKLCDVLLGHTSAPFSRASFVDYLAQNYCSEVLSFTNDVFKYQQEYKRLLLVGPTAASPQNLTKLLRSWTNIVDTYINPSSIQEINIPASVRNPLLTAATSTNSSPPSPDLLQSAYSLMLDLMNGVYLQWVATIHPDAPVTPVHLELKPCSSPVSSIAKECCPEFQDANVSFYKRAHGIWGSSRVYRKIRKSSKYSPGLDTRDMHSEVEEKHASGHSLFHRKSSG